MNRYQDNEETVGAKTLNWILIIGAAVLLLASVAAPVTKTVGGQQTASAAPIETVVVTASAKHA